MTLSLAMLLWPSLALSVPPKSGQRLAREAEGAPRGGKGVLEVVLLARALEEAGEGERAEGLLRSALAARPGEVALLGALGGLQGKQGRWGEAI